MHTLNGRNIIIGISGGIAAYKSADLCRRLMEAGADVRIVMTRAATQFITPLTMQALSGHPVILDENEDNADKGPDNAMAHIELARWADAIVIAPASANTIARLAQGRADNLLTSLCLASEAAKAFAPAMNRVMWQDLATQSNCRRLVEHGWLQLGPDSGLQACGETGEGRLLAVEDILAQLAQHFNTGELAGVDVVVTAGPTYEPIDPVRFIGNRSSGRMGYAIARAAAEAGARVTLISGPVALTTPEKVRRIDVETAAEMQQAVMAQMGGCELYISTAAVSDYRVKTPAAEKIKKSADSLSLELVRNDDILSAVAAHPLRPFVVGFAAETQNLVDNAREKLLRKKLDMILANDVSAKPDNAEANQPAIGFNSEYNALHLLWPDNHGEIQQQFLDIASKQTLARQLLAIITEQYRNRQTHEQDTA